MLTMFLYCLEFLTVVKFKNSSTNLNLLLIGERKKKYIYIYMQDLNSYQFYNAINNM